MPQFINSERLSLQCDQRVVECFMSHTVHQNMVM